MTRGIPGMVPFSLYGEDEINGIRGTPTPLPLEIGGIFGGLEAPWRWFSNTSNPRAKGLKEYSPVP